MTTSMWYCFNPFTRFLVRSYLLGRGSCCASHSLWSWIERHERRCGPLVVSRFSVCGRCTERLSVRSHLVSCWRRCPRTCASHRMLHTRHLRCSVRETICLLLNTSPLLHRVLALPIALAAVAAVVLLAVAVVAVAVAAAALVPIAVVVVVAVAVAPGVAVLPKTMIPILMPCSGNHATNQDPLTSMRAQKLMRGAT